jgi:murein DD-endopeptidase MepM/ murein hydrolase activator NlpD
MFREGRPGHQHEAIDIMMPKGTPVRAVVSGEIRRLFLSKPGGNTIYQFDDDEVYCYYYAHLDRYADGIREGMRVKRGDIIAYVGSTGNAHPAAPHLHFAIFELFAEKQWWKGRAIDPYPYLLATTPQ